MRHLDCAAADRRLLAAMREWAGLPGIGAAARTLSLVGEHAALWLAAGLTGAAADPPRRRVWLRATALVGGAHLASVGVKRVVRRPRPDAPLVPTASCHSFPSSHATSAAAAAVAFGALLPAGALLAPPLAAAMCVSRLIVGVHYPSDIVAGAALGGLTARLGTHWMTTGCGRDV